MKSFYFSSTERPPKINSTILQYIKATTLQRDMSILYTRTSATVIYLRWLNNRFRELTARRASANIMSFSLVSQMRKLRPTRNKRLETATASVTEDPTLRPASLLSDVLLPNPCHLFHGLETWKLIAPCWQLRITITCLKSQGQEPGATARPRLLSGFAFDISARAQMVLWPRRRGKDQHANLNIIIKDLLNAHCVQSCMLSSSGISKKVWAVIPGVEWLSLRRGARHTAV